MDSHAFRNNEFLDDPAVIYERYDNFHNTENCPSMSSSFLTIDTSGVSFNDDRRDVNGSTSPENLTMSSAMSIRSPITPIVPPGLSNLYDTASWPTNQNHGTWHPPMIAPESLWPITEEFGMANCVMNSFSSDSSSAFQPGYFSMHIKPRNHPDPPLSRAVFAHAASQKDHSLDDATAWPQLHNIGHPQTIEPSATFQNILPSSPSSEFEPITPLKHHRNSSSIFASSPLTGGITPILNSRYQMGEHKYVLATKSNNHQHERNLSHVLQSSQEFDDEDEISSPCSSQLSKSGVDCEAVIPQNIYACSVAGCIDKNGKPKRFKRQEHKKRHEKTVHKKDSKFPCWVRTGGKACGREFTRRDNLNSHLKKTHGRRSNNQRNSYVATLDETSEYFDEKWKGQLTSDGLPIGHPRWPSIH